MPASNSKMDRKARPIASKYENRVPFVIDSAGRSPATFDLAVPQGTITTTGTFVPLPTDLQRLRRRSRPNPWTLQRLLDEH